MSEQTPDPMPIRIVPRDEHDQATADALSAVASRVMAIETADGRALVIGAAVGNLHRQQAHEEQRQRWTRFYEEALRAALPWRQRAQDDAVDANQSGRAIELWHEQRLIPASARSHAELADENDQLRAENWRLREENKRLRREVHRLEAAAGYGTDNAPALGGQRAEEG